MRFTHDPESGAFYIRVREGEYYETLDLAEPGFGAYLDVDAQGNVLGAEFLSFEEYAEIVARHGGELVLPNRVTDPSDHPEIPQEAWGDIAAEALGVDPGEVITGGFLLIHPSKLVPYIAERGSDSG